MGGQLSIEGNNNKIIIKDGTVVDTFLVICIVDHNHIVEIGKKCSFVSTTISLADDSNTVYIGDDCMFSKDVVIMSSDFHSIIDMQTNKRINQSKDVYIGNHVWVGMDALILKGVNIGNHAIIGAKTIVNGVIPEYSLAVGNPAKVIRSNVTWERERRKKEEEVIKSAELKVVQGEIQYNLEVFDRMLNERAVEGWAFIKDVDNSDKRGWLKFIYKQGEKIVNLYLYNREDVGAYFNDKNYLLSGFRAYILLQILIIF